MPRETTIGQVASSKEAQAFAAAAKENHDWRDPISMDSLQAAVKKRSKSVILNGVKYLITYGFKRTYPVSKETVESIHLCRADGVLVPRGYMTIKEIEQFQFEEK